jgi:hypothetical protein
MTSESPRGAPGADRVRLLAILAVSYGLRVCLAVGGGQGFWPDEARYESARRAVYALAHHQLRTALKELFAHADHVLFRLVSLPAAIVQYWAGGHHEVLVSCYFSLFSVGAIYLVWAIARRAGASDREALWAAFLAAASNSLFFYSRHFLPYDSALLALLLALWLALGSYSASNSLRVGLVVGLGFLTYNGYWLLGACVLALHAALGDGGAGRAWRRAVLAGAGFLLVVATVIGLGQALSGNLIAQYQSFSGSVRQGDFYLGYRVIIQYLWFAERGLFLLFVAAFAYALAGSRRSRDLGRLKWWACGVVIVGGGLVFFSDVVPRFMVYGRLTREMVPFLCLGAGVGISRFMEARGRREGLYSGVLVALVLCVAAFNFAAPLRQVFPEKFRSLAMNEISARQGNGIGFYRILFAESLWGERLDAEIPPHTELLRRPNPLQFRPYQYEGFSAAQRKDINGHDVAMQLMDVAFQRGGEGWAGYPGPVHVKVLFRPDYWSESEPLIESGATGAGDVILATFIDPDHIAFGQDHWGAGSISSEPIRIDYTKPHDLVISEGSLVPPRGSELYKKSPELAGLCDQIVIVLDGRMVLSQHSSFYPSSIGAYYWGSNVIGASSVVPNFSGSVSEFGTAPLDQVAAGIPTMAAFRIAKNRPPEWNGAVGPVRLRFVMPAESAAAVAEPLLSINGGGTKDVIFAIRDGPGKIRVGFDRMGPGAVQSGPLDVAPSGVEELDLCIGSLLPGEGAAIYGRFPGLAAMRGMVYARLNSEPALSAPMPFTPVAGGYVTVGANSNGSSTYPANFDGKIASFEAIGPESIPSIGNRLADLLGNRDELWTGFTGPFRMQVVFPAGRTGQRDPLLSSGAKGAADTLFVQYDSDSEIRFGYEHSGNPPILSNPVSIKPGGTQELLLSSGALMPPENSDAYLKTPDAEPLQSFVHVGINGQPVLHEYAEPYPSNFGQVTVGTNSSDEASIEPRFQGTIRAITTARPLDALEEGRLGPKLWRPGWNGYPGPLAIKMVVPAGNAGEAQPIVTTGLRGIGDVIFLRYEAGGMARIGQDHWGSKLLLSEPFELTAGVEHEFTVSFGALYPPSDAAPIAGESVPAGLRGRTIVYFDGRQVLSALQPSHPSPPERIMVGIDLIGATTSHSIFSGQIGDVELAPIDAVQP